MSDDAALIERMEGFGVSVEVLDDDVIAAADLSSFDLVWISSTVSSTQIGTSLRGIEAPVGVHDAGLFDDFGMASSSGDLRGDYRVRLADGTLVTAYSDAGLIAWGVPGGDAEVIAVQRRSRTKATVFRYAAGAELADGASAPGCRTAFFAGPRAARNLTDDGWRLFDTEFAELLDCIPDATPNMAPRLNTVLDQQHDEFVPVVLQLDATDADGDVLRYSADGLPAGLVLDPMSGEISGQPTDVEESTSWTVVASVTDGEAVATIQFDWIVDDTGVEPPATPGPTNVIVVMTDDQTVEQMRWLPNVAEFMERGTVFENSMVNYPLCGPSRATFLTGQYATNHGLDCNPGIAAKFRRVHDDSLAPWLQAAGVHTIHVGKYLNGYGGKSTTRYTPAGWDDWRALAGSSAYNYTAFDMVINGEFTRYGRNGDNAYSTDVLSGHLGDALRSAPSDEAFFAVFTPLAPHYQGGRTYAIPAERHEGSITDVLRTPNYDSCVIRQSCPTNGSDLRKNRLSAAEVSRIDRGYQTSSESLLAVDEAFVEMVDTLTEIGRLDDTVIIFTSDNGFSYGEHGTDRGKKVPTRESLFVPLYIAGPGFESGAVSAPVVNADLAPTIVDLFDATPTLVMDGQSLLDPIDPDRSILIQAKRQPGTTGYFGVVAQDWILVDWIGPRRNDLYGPDDRWQLSTLDKMAEWNGVEASLGAEIAALVECSGASCQRTWQQPD